jgi:hypothetical protein
LADANGFIFEMEKRIGENMERALRVAGSESGGLSEWGK